MTNIIFEKSRKLDDQYQEYWTARQLAKDLDYAEYRNFLPVIEKAKISCANSGHDIEDHFVHINEMVKLGSTAQRQIDNIRLTRYACYLIVQNADPSKQIVALGQNYFASQTRKQELTEQHDGNHKRIQLRNEMKIHNKNLASAASRAGVTDYREFTEAGYVGLYGGMKSNDIHTHKWLKENEKILDHMNSEELAANLFRATQTEAKIKRDNIRWQKNATHTHYEVGKKVRDTIKDFGGTMPEDLPVVENIKLTEKKIQQQEPSKPIQ
jgi:DNA-damage-inducible protein D